MSTNDRIVTLATYYDPILAEIIRGRLEANDIPCFISDSNMATIQPLYNQAIGGVKINVFEHDLARSREILSQQEDISAEEPVADSAPSTTETLCPYCQSSNVRYGVSTNRRTSWLGAFISFLFLTYPFLANKVWHCFNCGKEFK